MTKAKQMEERPVSDPAVDLVESDPGPTPRSRTGLDLTRDLTLRFGVVAALVVLAIVFAVAEPDTFPTSSNLRSMLVNQSVLAVVALGVLAPLTVGEFDLSVGGLLSMSSVVTIVLLGHGLPAVLCIVVAIAACAVVGAVNGLLVTYVGISSFVATLGTATLVGGLSQWWSNNQTVFKGVTQGFRDFGTTLVGGAIPISGIYVLVLAVFLWYLLSRTPFGRQMLATGLGRDAARLAGIPTRGRTAISFVISGVFAGMAGVLSAAQLASASPGVGESLLLPAYAGAFLGATTIVVGRFNVFGTLAGVILLAIGITGLQLAGVENFISQIFNGAALVLAVTIARFGRRQGQV